MYLFRKISICVMTLLSLITFISAQETGEMLRFENAPNLELEVTNNILQKAISNTFYESPTSSNSIVPFNRVLFNGTLADSNLVLQISYPQPDGLWSNWHDVYMKVFTNGRFWARFDLPNVSARKLKYRLLNQGINTPARVEIYAVEVVDIKSTENTREIPGIPPQKLQFVPVDTIPQPPIITREEWGANSVIGTYVPHTPFRLTQHHTAGRRVATLEDGIAEQKFIQNFHQFGRGWQDIGYHFCMDDSGRIYEGVLPQYRGTHAGGNNTGNIGISLFGNYEIFEEFPTEKALESLVEIWSWLVLEYGVNPDSLFGHRDYNPTACPGENFYVRITELRNGIRKQLGFGAPYVVNPMPQPFKQEISPNTSVSFSILDDEEGVDLSSIVVQINNEVVLPAISGSSNEYQVFLQPLASFPYSQNVTVNVEASDLASSPNRMQYSFNFVIEVEALQAEIETGTTMYNATLELTGMWLNDDNDVNLPNLIDGRRLVTGDNDGSHVARIYPNVPEPGDYNILIAVNNTFLGESAHYEFGNKNGYTHPTFPEYNSVYHRKWGKISPTPVHFDDGNGYVELSGLVDIPTRLVLDAFRFEKVDRLDPPAPPTLKWVRRTNNISNEIEVAWYPSLEGDIAGYRLYQSDNGQIWSAPTVDEETLGADTDHYLLNYNGVSSKVYFRMVAVDTNQIEVEGQTSQLLKSEPTDTYGVGLSGGTKILIVDNFDRIASWRLRYHPFVKSHGDAINANGYGFDSCTETAVQTGEINLEDYDLVIYLCGDDSRSDESLAAVDQWRLLKYLEAGGNLFISGSEIGYDFDETTHSESERSEHLLKAKYLGDLSGSNRILGAGGTFFDGLDIIFGTMNTEDSYIEDFPDYILPAEGSEVALMYDNLRLAGIQFTGKYTEQTEEAKLIYLAFPFETITTEEDRADLMSGALNYFGFPTDVTDNTPEVPERFALSQNYPNPFILKANSFISNSSTVIHFSIPQDTQVKVDIYNLLGQHVTTLTNRSLPAGRHHVKWDGQTRDSLPAASGIYVYRFEAGSFQTSRKLLLVR